MEYACQVEQGTTEDPNEVQELIDYMKLHNKAMREWVKSYLSQDDKFQLLGQELAKEGKSLVDRIIEE